MNAEQICSKWKINKETLLLYIDRVIKGELSARKAAKLCLRPNAQAPHFISKARSLLTCTDSRKLQAFNEQLESNRPHIKPEIREKIISEYLAGASQCALIRKYHMWWATVRKILVNHGVPIRQESEQLILRFHGKVPRVAPGLTKEKLYIAFAMLGDNASRNHAPTEHNYKVGIAAGGDREFAEVWCDNFEKAYGLHPKINEKIPNCIIAGMGCKQAWLDLHRYFSFGTYDWEIKHEAMNFLLTAAPIDSLGYALQAFCEAEGCMEIDKSHGINRRVVIKSINRSGLEKIQLLLERLNIKSKLYAYTSTNYLIVSQKSNLEKFGALIDFTSKRKRIKLKEALETYSTNQRL